MHILSAITVVLLLVVLSSPTQAKTKRNLFTDTEISQARENVEKNDWARTKLEDARKDVEWILEMPDEELWDFIPPAEQPRALNVRFGFGCPIHGKEIFKVGANYPWTMDRAHPFKLKCPVGNEVYPTNDFEPWGEKGKHKLDTRQKYVDDGYGWIDDQGNRYWFVAHYIFWQRWRRDILATIPKLAFVYLLTDDTRYSHKAAVMLARVASEYPKMDYRTQAYHNGRWPSGYNGKILDLDWEGSATVVPLATAYDQIYDALDSDTELKAFLAAKRISNVREFIEANFLQEAAKCIEANIIHGNMNYQSELALVATVLDNSDPTKGLTTEQMVEWIMHGGGEMNVLLYNGISRDGAASEESIGYTTIWTMAFYDLAKRLKPLGYDLFTNPRLKKMADFYIQTAVGGRFSPRIGDASGDMIHGAAPIWNSAVFGKAYEIWKDPSYAKVLNRIGWPQPSIYEKPKAAEELEERETFGTEFDLKTRDLGGYGLAILETETGSNRRAVSMFYGSSGAWHGHLDRLNIEMWAHGKPVLPEIGYPAHWGSKAEYWTRSTPSHYCVQIDEERQNTKLEGHLNFLAASPEVQVMDASAENSYRGVASLYRRTVAMVDGSPDNSYLVDVFRVNGGFQHDYSLHGPAFGDLSLSGVTLGSPQETGTLMGEDVDFGRVFDGMKTGGFQYLSNVRRGRPKGKWSANWLVNDTGHGLRITMLPNCAQEVIVADCEPEAKPGYPENMEYVLARNKANFSSYVSVVEPYRKKPFVRRVQALRSGGGVGEQDLAAVRVDCKGRTDYVFSALDVDRTFQILNSPLASMCGDEPITFQGEFGALSEDSFGFRSILLINSTQLQKGKYGVRPTASLDAGAAEVDYRNNSVTLDRKVPLANALVGQVVVFSNERHSASFTVTRAETLGGRTVLHFGNIELVEGIGEIKSVADASKIIVSSTRFGGYGIKWQGKLLPGRALVNESRTEHWPITTYENGSFAVSADGSIDERLTDADGDGHRIFFIGEINAGDRAMIPAIISVTRTEPGAYEIRATTPFELTLPISRFAEPVLKYLSDGRWKTADAVRHRDTLSVRLDGRVLANGRATMKIDKLYRTRRATD